MSRPEISVVVATFDRPRLLARALQSLVGQTFGSFEVVVVNDGGVDVSDVVDRFTGRLDVHLVSHPVNRGVTAAQNTGGRQTGGAYICFLNDDDLFLPHHLATLHEAAVARPGAIIYSDGARVFEDEAGRALSREVLPRPDEFDRDMLLVTNYIPAITLLIPRALWIESDGFDESLEVLEDWELWIRLSGMAPTVHVAAVTCEYRLRGGRGNITTREVPRFHECLEKVYAKHPVDDPALVAGRQEIMEGSRPRLREHVVDETIVVEEPDAAELRSRLAAIEANHTEGEYEVLAFVPPTDEMRALSYGGGGALTMLFVDGSDQDLEVVARRKAAGRIVVFEGDAAAPGTSDVSPPRFVVAGTGRSGSGFISRVLSEAGIRTGHEEWWNPFGTREPGLVGDSSWLAVPDLAEFSAGGGIVLHQARDPLAVLDSLLATGLLTDPVSEYRRFISEHVTLTGDAVRDAVTFVGSWLERIEAHAIRTWRVEDVNTALVVELGGLVGVEVGPDLARRAIAAVPSNYNQHRTGDRLRWGDLPAGAERDRLLEMATQMGYSPVVAG